MNKCPNCGYTSTSKFCVECGTKMEEGMVVNTPPKTYANRSQILRLCAIYADIQINFKQGDDTISIEIEGDEEMKQAVEFDMVGRVLTVTGKLPGVTGSLKYADVSLINDDLVVDDVILDPAHKLIVKVYMPWVSKLEVLEHALGTIRMLNNGGAFGYTASGLMVSAGCSFETLLVKMDASARFDVQDVVAHLEYKVSGSAKFSAGFVVTDNTQNEVSGSGKVQFESIHGNHNLVASGSGKMESKKTNCSEVLVVVSGSGKAAFGNGLITALRITASSSGKFDFDGHAVHGYFNASTSGKIDIGDGCSNVHERVTSSSGKINL